MKLRLGFVSNSSSSSFVLDKSKLTAQQRHKIMHAVQSSGDLWEIEDVEGQDFLRFDTWMDNLGLGKLIEAVGAADAVVYGEVQSCDWKTGEYTEGHS
jgi:hypothetical protein